MEKYLDKVLKFYETFLHIPVMILAVICLFLNLFLGESFGALMWGLIILVNIFIYFYINYIHNGEDEDY